MPSIRAAGRIVLYSGLAFLISFVVLAWDINRNGIAASYDDPVSHIRAVDEAYHFNSAIRMTQDGDWMTPKLLGRLFLFKPPLLIWLSALSIRLFGLSLFSVRLPALVLGAAGTAAVFAWTARARSVTAGVLASGVLLCSPLWQTFSRLCFTDVLYASFAALALAGAAFDPALAKRGTRIAFGVLGAAAILAKSLAGLLPFAALLLFWFATARDYRPRFSRLAGIFLVAALIALPWHIYQVIVHPRWFWAEYVQIQLLGIGLRADLHSILDLPILYYLRRLVEMDLVIAVLAVASFAGALRVVRSRKPSAALLAVCWIAVTLTGLCVFQARNLSYLVFLLPSLCIMGAVCAPRFLDQRPTLTALAIAILFLAKIAVNGQVWSLRPAAPPLPGAQAMRVYNDLHRDAELIAVQPDDEFYSANISLPHVRYSLLDPQGVGRRFGPHYAFLGILLTPQQFVDLPALLPEFERRLRDWGLNSIEPIGSNITLNAPSDVADIVQARPGSDFYLPSAWLTLVPDRERDHELMRYSTDRVFLLSRRAGQRAQPVPALPAHW